MGHDGTFAPAMSTIRSPHLTIMPNPIIAASFATSTLTASSSSSSSNVDHQSPIAAFTRAYSEPLVSDSLPPSPPPYTFSATPSPLASTIRPSSSHPAARPTSSASFIITVADRFLDEPSRVRHEQQQHRQSTQYPIPINSSTNSTNATNSNNNNGPANLQSVQIIEAAPPYPEL